MSNGVLYVAYDNWVNGTSVMRLDTGKIAAFDPPTGYIYVIDASALATSTVTETTTTTTAATIGVIKMASKSIVTQEMVFVKKK